MSKVVEIAETSTVKRRKKSYSSADTPFDQEKNFAYRLFLVVDVAAYDLIVWLKDVLEAPSFGDVVRQAVRVYALKLADTGNIKNDVCELPVDPDLSGKLKKLNIRIPNRTKARLDMLKAKTGATFTDIIICGLDILANTAEEQEDILTKLERSSVHVLDRDNAECNHKSDQENDTFVRKRSDKRCSGNNHSKQHATG